MNLITGSEGFVGSHLLNRIPNSIGLDKKLPLNLNSKHINLLDKDSLCDLFSKYKFKYVFHNAALAGVPQSYDEKLEYYENNVVGSINLIRLCEYYDSKIIFASTSSVSGESPYGHSKKIIEDILLKCDVKFTVLRYFNVFGKGQRQNVISQIYDAITNDKIFNIYGDGNTSRDFTYIDNVVAGNIKAMSDAYNGTINELGTGVSISLIEAYETIKKITNKVHNKINFGEERVGDIKYSKANTILNSDEITYFKSGVIKWLSES
jgi:nucleoside-diphosphate-sugar epimerase